MTARLTRRPPAGLDPRQRALYDTLATGPRGTGPALFRLVGQDGALEGPFGVMLLAPHVGTALQEVGRVLRFGGTLADRSRELAVLTVARARRSSFEWYAHAAVGRAAGLTAAELAALLAGEVPASLSAPEQVLVHTVDALLTARSLTDGQYAAADAALGAESLAELVVLVGYYDLLALAMGVWEVGLPAGEPDPFASPAAAP